jgi:DNA-binding NarL/FixJ family response regulator
MGGERLGEGRVTSQPIAAPPVSGLHDRETELALAARAIERATSSAGGTLLVEGPPGIGKTTLLAAIRTLAADAGMQCLSATGLELETPFPYGVVGQLLELRVAGAPPSERAELLAGAARLSGPVFGLRSPGAPVAAAGVDSYPLLHGLYWLAVNVAARRPLLLLVDDAQWADGPSLKWLAYAAARLEDVPILLVLAARPPGHDEAGTVLETLADSGSVTAVRPSPLSRGGVAAVVRDALGAGAGERFCEACATSSGGNPFLLRELTRDLARAGVVPDDAAVALVREVGPDGVARSVRRRIAALPAPTLRVARAASVLGDRGDVADIGALLGLDQREVALALAALSDAGVLAGGPPVRFAHPIVRNAVYRCMPAGDRAAAHARAARILDRRGAPRDQLAGHLLQTHPDGDPWAVATLRGAAAAALGQGAPGAAARYLARALLDADGAGERRAILEDLGVAESRAGDPAAIGHLRQALEGSDRPADRARVGLALGRALVVAGRVPEAVDLLAGVVESSPNLDDDDVARMESELIGASRLDVRSRAIAVARLSRFDPPPAGERPGERLLLGHLAHEAVIRGDPAGTGAELARRSLHGGALLAEAGPESPTFYVAAWTLGLCESMTEAIEALGAALRTARETGSVLGFALASCFRANVYQRHGLVREAEADARNAIAVSERGWHPLAVAFLVDALVERGELREAEGALEGIGMLGDVPDLLVFQPLLYSRGDLRIAQGRTEAGVADLLEAGQRSLQADERTPAFRGWRSAAALALADLGRRDQAAELIADELALARRFGAPRALGGALRAAGLLRDGAEALALLDEAVAALEGSQARLELARALVDRGARRRARDHRGALCDLREAMRLAQQCGAAALAERARRELVAAGSRLRRPPERGVETLTPSELRVARMAADGQRNREIAQALFVTLKTVEWHLSRAYRKLGVSSRHGLAGALDGDGLASSAS